MKKSLSLLTQFAQNDKNVVLIAGDLGFGLFDDFRAKCPKQFINAGVAEQNMLSVACGMALAGKTVFVYSIANFPTLRALEQIRNDVCYHHANVKIITGTAGFNYGNLGMSHHTTSDIAALQAIPDLRIYNPGDTYEAMASLNDAYKVDGPCFIRLGWCDSEYLYKNEHIDVTKPIELHKGTNVLLLVSGSLLDDTLNVLSELQKKGIDPSIVSCPMIKPLDKKIIEKYFTTYEQIITIEEHSIIGGFGATVASIGASIKEKKAIQNLIGIPDETYFEVGSYKHLKEYFSLTGKPLLNRLVKLIK